MTEHLMDGLRARIVSHINGDSSPLLDGSAQTEVDQLWKDAAHPVSGGIPLSAVNLIAWWHWCRSEALADERGRADLQHAVALFSKIADVDDTLLPDGLRV